MRRLVIVLAVGLALYSLVKGRRAASLTKKNWRRSSRTRAVGKAVHQKPGQVKVPTMPKVDRPKG